MASSKLAKRFNLLNYTYAHRGQWSHDGPPENSLAAYLAAAEIGIGIEMDVRPSSEGTPVCFHDPDLSRTTHSDGLVCEKSDDELRSTQLVGGGTIPLFSDLLECWPEDLPILVEMKIDGTTDPVKFTNVVAGMLDEFSGLAAMMSFDESAVDTIPQSIMKGQLIKPSSEIGSTTHKEKLLRALGKPIDYLALHVSNAEDASNVDMPVVCWTVRSIAQRANIEQFGFAEIFEHLPTPLAAQ